MFGFIDKFKKEEADLLAGIREAASECMRDVEKDDWSSFVEDRIALNLQLITAVVGGEVKKDKSGEKVIKFNKSFPTIKGLSEIETYIESYRVGVENAYLEKKLSDGEEGFDAPAAANYDSKISLKKFGKELTKGSLVHTAIGAADLSQLYAWATEVRKNHNRKCTFVAGGILLVAVGGCIVAKKVKDKKDEEKEDEIEDEPTADDIAEITDEDKAVFDML